MSWASPVTHKCRDMQEERDVFAKKIMPQIRKMCAERDISFSFVGKEFS
jgi:hypothetical protein